MVKKIVLQGEPQTMLLGLRLRNCKAFGDVEKTAAMSKITFYIRPLIEGWHDIDPEAGS